MRAAYYPHDTALLDVGDGAGIQSLALQDQGVDVTGIDVAPECVTIMRERGLHRAELAEMYAFEGGPIDKVIYLCNGPDKVGFPRRTGHDLIVLQRKRSYQVHLRWGANKIDAL
jgi:Methyltransferase domain